METDDFLPLTHLGIHVLVALVDRPMHGYAIARDVRDRSEGRVDPGTGSFYSVIHGLVTKGLLVTVDAPDAEADDRRRYYSITPLGRRVLAAETARLQSLLRDGQRRPARSAASQTEGR